MDSAKKNATLSTPRRSQRIHRYKEETPEKKDESENRVRGPRSMAKLNRSKKKDRTEEEKAATPRAIPKLTITRPSLPKRISEKGEEADAVINEPTVDKSSYEQEGKQISSKRKKASRSSQKTNKSPENAQSSQSSLEFASCTEDTVTAVEKTSDDIVDKTLEEVDVVQEFLHKDVPKKIQQLKENDKIAQVVTEKAIEKAAVVQEAEANEGGDSFVATVPEKDSIPVQKSKELSLMASTTTAQPPTVAPSQENDQIVSNSENVAVVKSESYTIEPAAQVHDVTPQLMDESIIFVPESPPEVFQLPTKDSTFSPVVDTSLHDSRPHIDDLDFNVTPKLMKNITVRTSTPLAHKLLKNSVATPKRSVPAMSSLAKVLTPMVAAKADKTIDKQLDETLNGQFKMLTPWDKSILKSSRRKRSMSVTDAEPFMQKRVMFISPQIMEITEIDSKMMASFFEEKENSMMQQAANSSRRKRSLSTGTPIKKERPPSRVKMPNFRAIHEQQFQKMESIADHAHRKAERAKKLTTPTRDQPQRKSQEAQTSNGGKLDERKSTEVQAKPQVQPAVQVPKQQQSSKIPTINSRKPLSKAPSVESLVQAGVRKPLSKTPSLDTLTETGLRKPLVKKTITENLLKPSSRTLKRSMSANTDGPSVKKVVASASMPSTSIPKRLATVSESQKQQPAPTYNFAFGTRTTAALKSGGSVAQMNRSKIEERRERNMSLYKSTQVQRSATEKFQNKNDVLKGVRLNRRFELHMQQRAKAHDEENQKTSK